MSDLQDYIDSDDPNYFWRLSSGQHENLLDAAIEYGERLEQQLQSYIEREERLGLLINNWREKQYRLRLIRSDYSSCDELDNCADELEAILNR